MKFENTSVWGFKHALRGMRNPKESWGKSDSKMCENFGKCLLFSNGDCHLTNNGCFIIGDKDLQLAKNLIKAGNEHRKFIRQIFVSVDITAPLFWWKEMDTYKISTTSNSTSTMHKISSKEITIDMFELDDVNWLIPDDVDDNGVSSYDVSVPVKSYIYFLETLRKKYLYYNGLGEIDKDYNNIAKKYWKELIRWLPESWLQTRTITMNYENIYSIYNQRRGHKLTEWHTFRQWAEGLPYFRQLFL